MNKYVKIFASVILTTLSSIGIIYAASGKISTLFDEASEGSILTHTWVILEF